MKWQYSARGLLFIAVVALGARGFGIIGAVLLGVLMLGLSRWPKAQIITGATLAVLLFATVVLFSPPRSAVGVVSKETASAPPVTVAEPWNQQYAQQPSAPVKLDVEAPFQSPSKNSQLTNTQEDWNSAAIAFENGHPDLRLGTNTQIMQRAINSMDSGQPPAQLLEIAYAAAKQDSAWTSPTSSQIIDPYANAPPPQGFVLDTASATNTIDSSNAPNDIAWNNPSSGSPQAPTNSPTTDYVQATIAGANACRAQGGEYSACWVKASPRRCTQQTLALLSNPGENRRAWALCVRSCADADVTSQWFGECHRESF